MKRKFISVGSDAVEIQNAHSNCAVKASTFAGDNISYVVKVTVGKVSLKEVIVICNT